MFKLGRILGIEVSLHWTLLLLIAFAGLTTGSAALTAALFGCVLLHELGHSMAARQFGIETDSIVLLPIGGIASLERMPREPLQELWIAVAGPLVNVVIATVLYFFVGLPDLTTAPTWWQTLLIGNICLVCFNMLPAFPMDGGRVLRATLALRLPYVNATQIAAKVGRVMAVLLAAVAIYYVQLMLLLVAGFVYFAGSAEARMVMREQVQSDWGGAFATAIKNAPTFTAQRAGRTAEVIWDEVAGKYRYASQPTG